MDVKWLSERELTRIVGWFCLLTGAAQGASLLVIFMPDALSWVPPSFHISVAIWLLDLALPFASMMAGLRLIRSELANRSWLLRFFALCAGVVGIRAMLILYDCYGCLLIPYDRVILRLMASEVILALWLPFMAMLLVVHEYWRYLRWLTLGMAGWAISLALYYFSLENDWILLSLHLGLFVAVAALAIAVHLKSAIPITLLGLVSLLWLGGAAYWVYAHIIAGWNTPLAALGVFTHSPHGMTTHSIHETLQKWTSLAYQLLSHGMPVLGLAAFYWYARLNALQAQLRRIEGRNP